MEGPGMETLTKDHSSSDEAAERAALRRRGRRRRWRWALALALGLAFMATFHRFFFLENFAAIDPGRAYRSSQPKSRVERTLQTHAIASILNLRGGSPDDWWYAAETAAAERLGVDFYDLPMSAVRRPRRDEMMTLADLFTRCRYPVLIHCRSGSDRTGLAAAVYRLVVLGQGPEEAHAAFSIWRGHVPLFGPERLHDPIHEYAAWLRAKRLPHAPERFRAWLERDYRPEGPRDGRAPRPLPPGPRGLRRNRPAPAPAVAAAGGAAVASGGRPARR